MSMRLHMKDKMNVAYLSENNIMVKKTNFASFGTSSTCTAQNTCSSERKPKSVLSGNSTVLQMYLN